MADYIDRQAIGIGVAKREAFENPAYADGWNACIKIINEAPAADVAPVVHAHWEEHIIHSQPIEGWATVTVFYSCSNCNTNEAGPAPYCRMCGAKMDEEVKP